MFRNSLAFSGFSVNDISKALEFYGQKLGLEVKDTGMGLEVQLQNNAHVFIYEKPDHVPAGFTILNFVVEDIDKAARELSEAGISLVRYDGLHQDETGIARGKAAGYGPDILWFTDPAGNILSALQN